MKMLFDELKFFFKEPGTIKVGQGDQTISVTFFKDIITIQDSIAEVLQI